MLLMSPLGRLLAAWGAAKKVIRAKRKRRRRIRDEEEEEEGGGGHESRDLVKQKQNSPTRQRGASILCQAKEKVRGGNLYKNHPCF